LIPGHWQGTILIKTSTDLPKSAVLTTHSLELSSKNLEMFIGWMGGLEVSLTLEGMTDLER
jgi:hypothetical protein